MLERKGFTGKRLLKNSNNTSFDKEALFLGSIIFVVGKSPMDIMEPILL